MKVLERGRYRAHFVESDSELARVLALRSMVFRGDRDGEKCDRDAFDDECKHLLVEDKKNGAVVSGMRVLPLAAGREIHKSYSAQFYNLDGLSGFSGVMIEMGRFCVHPAYRDPDILRIAWGALTAYVDAHQVEFLFGCASFRGTEANEYREAFSLLRERHVGPKRWLPKIKAAQVYPFTLSPATPPDAKRSLANMPPLLRTYLLMGGWVSDHAVIDRDLGTLHVFTGLEVGAVPVARARLLRRVAS
jgi:putative hemolysin